MKIIEYQDLKSRSCLLPLMEQAFGWPFNEQEFDRFVKIDPRLRKSPVGFCALEGDKVVSYVGVMDLPTRTLGGAIEYAGGVYGVATLPGFTRRGFSKALFSVVHEYFKDKGYLFSFLNTSPILVAHYLYRKLGYVDFVYYPSAYKALGKRRRRASKEKAASKLNLEKMLALYNRYVKEKAGFVARDMPFMEFLKKDKRLTGNGVILRKRGYIVFKKERYSTRVQELVALDIEEAERLVEEVEEKARDVVFAKGVLDKDMLRVYKSRGYAVLKVGHGVFMAQPLRSGVSLAQVYGKAFFQTRLDHF